MHVKTKQLMALMLILLFFAFQSNAQCPNSYTANNTTLPTCPNSSNGYIYLSGTTYYSGSTYSWSNGETSRHLYNLSPGHYTVTVTDPTTCTYTATTYLPPNPDGLTPNLNWSPCQRTLFSWNWAGVQPYTYQWNNGNTTSQIVDPAPGVYSVTLTDATGCSGTETITIIPYGPPISATHTSTPATCNNSNGTVDLTPAGGLPPYTYYWYHDGATTQDHNNLTAGNQRVSIRDANNCYYYYDINVGGPQVDFTKINMSCGLNNGSVTANTQSFTNPTYNWSNGANTQSITGLSNGTYTVTVSDGACVVTATTNVWQGGNVNVWAAADTNSSCDIETVTANVWGGAPPYTYLWSTGETTSSINYVPGVSLYGVTVTDANGCAGVDTADVHATGQFSLGLTYSITDATCGNSDGAVDITLVNPWGGETFYWSPTGATTEDITGIAAGFHVVEVYPAFGLCPIIDTFQVGEFILFSSTDASCNLTNGSATVHDYGMTNPSYAWNTGATTNTITGLAGGDYTITVTNGACVIIDTVTIVDQGMMTAGIQLSSTCQPDYVTAIPTGGAAPYSYLWNTSDVSQAIATPTPGNMYYVSITDANGCVDSASILIPNPPLPTASASVTDATCNNKNGSIHLTLNGGTLPYNYNWSLGGGNSKHLIGVYPGQYSVNITDNNGCQVSLQNIVVGGQTNINVTRVITQVNASNTGGAIDITVSNVSNPSYSWSNGANTEDINNLSSGHYTVTITDNTTGCTFTRTYYLPGPYVSNPTIKIIGYVYDITGSGLCQTSGALPLQYEMVRLMPGNIIRFTDQYGRYRFNVTTPGTYTVEYINNSSGTTVICPATSTYTITNAQQGSCYSNNFYVQNPPSQDLRIDLWDWTNATPGFPYKTRIKYCNDGNINMSNGTVEYDYNALLGFQYISGYNSVLTLHDIPNHKFYWSFNNLLPNQCRFLDVHFYVPTNTLLGTGLAGTADVFPLAGDVTPVNNTDGEYTTVVGSWDPNDKQVEPYHTGDAWNGGIIYTTDDELEYTIRFQNTGTAPANFVIIRDTLDANLLPETIREIDSRHNAEVSIENGNILVFTFNNIYLPDSSADLDASMGFVKFKINRISGLPVGTQIENTAAIYFDYNAPVITNTPISIIDEASSVVHVENGLWEVQTMPNPFNERLTVKYELEAASDVSIRVLNSVGQLVYTHVANQEQSKGAYIEHMDLSHLPAGMYLLHVETSEAVVTKKIVKQ